MPEAFIDRSLGSIEIAHSLRAVGMTVHVMRDHYGENIAQTIGDDVWIPAVTALGWVIFSKDYAMRTDHLDTIRECGARVFLLPDAQMRADDQGARYVDNRFRIAQRCLQRGPMLFRVDRMGLTRLPLTL